MHEMIVLSGIPIVSNFSDEIDFIKNDEKLKFLCISLKNKVNDWINVILKILLFSEYEYNKIVEELQKSRSAIHFKNFGDNWSNIIKNFSIWRMLVENRKWIFFLKYT